MEVEYITYALNEYKFRIFLGSEASGKVIEKQGFVYKRRKELAALYFNPFDLTTVLTHFFKKCHLLVAEANILTSWSCYLVKKHNVFLIKSRWFIACTQRKQIWGKNWQLCNYQKCQLLLCGSHWKEICPLAVSHLYRSGKTHSQEVPPHLYAKII